VWGASSARAAAIWEVASPSTPATEAFLPHSRPGAGVHRDDIERFEHALPGLTYPAQKWQLIAS
jgi:hypothetical protein